MLVRSGVQSRSGSNVDNQPPGADHVCGAGLSGTRDHTEIRGRNHDYRNHDEDSSCAGSGFADRVGHETRSVGFGRFWVEIFRLVPGQRHSNQDSGYERKENPAVNYMINPRRYTIIADICENYASEICVSVLLPARIGTTAGKQDKEEAVASSAKRHATTSTPTTTDEVR